MTLSLWQPIVDLFLTFFIVHVIISWVLGVSGGLQIRHLYESLINLFHFIASRYWRSYHRLTKSYRFLCLWGVWCKGRNENLPVYIHI